MEAHQIKTNQVQAQALKLYEIPAHGADFVGSTPFSLFCSGFRAADFQSRGAGNFVVEDRQGYEVVSGLLLEEFGRGVVENCSQLEALSKAQFLPLVKEIEKHKLYTSQKAGEDIGWENATEDFTANFLGHWLRGYFVYSCNIGCADSNTCSCAFEKVDID